MRDNTEKQKGLLKRDNLSLQAKNSSSKLDETKSICSVHQENDETPLKTNKAEEAWTSTQANL